MNNDDIVNRLFERGKQAKVDFEDYLRFVFGITVAKHEREWVKACQNIGDNPTSGLKYLTIAPPGGGKSQIAIAFLSWMIGRYPNSHFGLLSYADRPAWDRSGAIRKIIEQSKPYHFTFPHVKPDRRNWGTSVFKVLRPNIGDPHPTLRAGGTRSAVVSYRLDGLMIDDAMDIKNSATKEQREKVYENYQQSILTRMVEGAWQWTIGTRWSEDDFIGRLIKRGGWEVIYVPALTKNPKTDEWESYWPERYSVAYLLDIKYKYPALFAIQYNGDTTGGEAGIIRKILTYDTEPELFVDEESPEHKELLIGIGIDSSVKDRKDSDYGVIYCGGLDKNGRLWILDRLKGHWGLPELIDNIQEAYFKWHPFGIWIEDAASGTPAVQVLMEESPGIPIMAVTPSGNKNSRAHALSQWLHGAHIIFPKYSEWFEDAKDELTHYGYSGYDDDVDALFVLADNLFSARHPAEYDRMPSMSLRMQ